eukprot:1073650-Pyramimonas_sp.AAC.1
MIRDLESEHLRALRVLDPRVAKLGLEDLWLAIRGSRIEPRRSCHPAIEHARSPILGSRIRDL